MSDIINTNQNTEQQPATPTPEASGGQGGEKMFTQADLDRIVGERLARAKKDRATDEQFATENKKALLTNQDFSRSGAHSVRVYKVTTSKMNDYGRSGPAEGNWSRYGYLRCHVRECRE